MAQLIRSTTLISVVTHHQSGISAIVSQTSYHRETSGDVAKCRLFSQANTQPNSIQPLNASLISRSVVSYLSTITPKHLKNLLKDLTPCWFRCEVSWQSPSTKSTFDRQKIDKLECKVMSLSCGRPIERSVIEPNQTAIVQLPLIGFSNLT